MHIPKIDLGEGSEQKIVLRLFCSVVVVVVGGGGGDGVVDVQSERKCVIVASAMRAEQGPCSPVRYGPF